MPPIVRQFVGDPGVKYKNVLNLGYPYYMIGDDGSVWSRWIRATRGKARASPFLGTEWMRVHIISTKDGRQLVDMYNPNLRIRSRLIYVHKLVLTAFRGLCPDGMEACHFPNRDPSDNRLCNLRWDTRKANMADRDAHGTTARGSRCGLSKYTEEFVARVRTEAATLPQYGRVKFLSKKHGIPWSTTKKIILGYGWKHVAVTVPYVKRSNGKGQNQL